MQKIKIFFWASIFTIAAGTIAFISCNKMSTNADVKKATISPNMDISQANLRGTSDQEIQSFLYSAEYTGFSDSNNAITGYASTKEAQMIVTYNAVISDSVTNVVIPVITRRGDTTGIIVGTPEVDTSGVRHYLIFYQDNSGIIRESNGHIYGTVYIDLFNSNTSYTAETDINDSLRSYRVMASYNVIHNNSTISARSWPSGDCIDHVMDAFWDRCHGGCRFMCRFADVFGFATCTGGQYIGASLWCSNHGNNWSSY